MSCCLRRRAPLRLDPHVEGRRLPGTIIQYRRAVAVFLAWCNTMGVWPHTFEELDDLLVEWKNIDTPPRSLFHSCFAAMELVFPGSKTRLSWAKSVGIAWDVQHCTSHHKPLPQALALLFAAAFALLGYCRLGAGLVIQQAKGLRPSELLGLRGADIYLPSLQVFGKQNAVVLNLGSKHGTKSKRAQSAVLNGSEHPIAYALAVELSASTPSIQYVFNGISLSQYQNVLRKASTLLGLHGYTPHSPRAGFASDAMLNNKGFVNIREEGRWLSDASLRVYLDIVSTAQQGATADVKHWEQVITFLSAHFLDMLPRWQGCPASPTRELPIALIEAFNKFSHPGSPPSSKHKLK